MFKVPSPANMSLNLAPMVDVMMCLIIFFLLAAKLVSAEQHPVQLAWAIAAKEVESGELGARVTINVRKSPDSENDADYIVVDWDGSNIKERVLKPEDLATLLQARVAAAAGQGPDKAEKGRKVALKCVIRADEEVQYQHVETVLRACGIAKVSDIMFSAKKGAGPAGSGARP